MMRILRPMSGLALPLVRRKVADIHAPVRRIMLSRWTPGRMRLAHPEKLSAELAGRQQSFHPVNSPIIGRKVQPTWQAMDLVLPNGASTPESSSNKMSTEQQLTASELLKKLTSSQGAPKISPSLAQDFKNPFGPLPPEKPVPQTPSAVFKKPEPGSRIFRKIEEIHAQSEKAADQPPPEPAAPAAPAAEPQPTPARPAFMRKVEEVTSGHEMVETEPSSSPVYEPLTSAPSEPPAPAPVAPVQRAAASAPALSHADAVPAPTPLTPIADPGVTSALPAPVRRRAWKEEVPAKNPYDDEPENAYPATFSQQISEPEPWEQETLEAENSAPSLPSNPSETAPSPFEASSATPPSDLPEVQVPEPRIEEPAASEPFSPPEATLRHSARPQLQTAAEPTGEIGQAPAIAAQPAVTPAQISRSPEPHAQTLGDTPFIKDPSPEPNVQPAAEPTWMENVEPGPFPTVASSPSPVRPEVASSPETGAPPAGDALAEPPATVQPGAEAAASPSPARMDLPVTTHRPGVQRRAVKPSEPEPAPAPETQPGAVPAENRTPSVSTPQMTPGGTPSLQRETGASPQPAVPSVLQAAEPPAPADVTPAAGPTRPSVQRAAEAVTPVPEPKGEPPFNPPAAPAAGQGEGIPSSPFLSGPEPLQRQPEADVPLPPPVLPRAEPDVQPGSEPPAVPASTPPVGPQSAAPLQRAPEPAAPAEPPAREPTAPQLPALQRMETQSPSVPAGSLPASPVETSLPEIPGVVRPEEPGVPSASSALPMDLAPRRHTGQQQDTIRPEKSPTPSPASPAGIPSVQRTADHPISQPVTTASAPGPAVPEPTAPRSPEIPPSVLPSSPVESAQPLASSAAPGQVETALPPTAPAGDLPAPRLETLQARSDLPLEAPVQRAAEEPVQRASEEPVGQAPQAGFSEPPSLAAPAAQPENPAPQSGQPPAQTASPSMPVVQRMSEYSRVYRSLAASLKRENPLPSPAAGSERPAPAPTGWLTGPRSPQGERTPGFVLRRFRPLAAAKSAAAAAQPFFSLPSGPQVQRSPSPAALPPQRSAISAPAAKAENIPARASGELPTTGQAVAPAPAFASPPPFAPDWQPTMMDAAPGEIRPLLRPGTLVSRASLTAEPSSSPAASPSLSPLAALPWAMGERGTTSPAGRMAPETSVFLQRFPDGAADRPTDLATLPAASSPIASTRSDSAVRPVKMVFRHTVPADPATIRRSPPASGASNYVVDPPPPEGEPEGGASGGDNSAPSSFGQEYLTGQSSSTPQTPPTPRDPFELRSPTSDYGADAQSSPASSGSQTIAPYELLNYATLVDIAPMMDDATMATLQAIRAEHGVQTAPSPLPPSPQEAVSHAADTAVPQQPDIKDLARKVYPLIKRMLALERERTFSRRG